MNFFIDDIKHNNLSSTSLSINFNIEKPNYNKEVRIVSGEECIEQAIKIRLATALGSVRENLDIDNEFVRDIVYGVLDNKDALDNVINKYITNWYR